MRPDASSLWIVLDEADLSAQSENQHRYAPVMFAFRPEWRSASCGITARLAGIRMPLLKYPPIRFLLRVT